MKTMIAMTMMGTVLLTSGLAHAAKNCTDEPKSKWMSVEEFKKQGLDPVVATAEEQITRSRISITGFHTGKGVVASKSIGDKVSSLGYKNLKFQFNRVVRSKLPF